jgi:hypothetical protein
MFVIHTIKCTGQNTSLRSVDMDMTAVGVLRICFSSVISRYIFLVSSVADPDGSGKFTTKSESGSSSGSKKKISVSVQYRAYVFLFTPCDSSIGIGRATRHHEFNNDEIGFCLVLGIVCHSMYQY